mmetsp:Transcript_4921/g.14016  ORF Transcript_4921/g.14016 Transcript_4921/m.14016 type:complete len:231 (+) Transcript_4921:51-743(+)
MGHGPRGASRIPTMGAGGKKSPSPFFLPPRAFFLLSLSVRLLLLLLSFPFDDATPGRPFPCLFGRLVPRLHDRLEILLLFRRLSLLLLDRTLVRSSGVVDDPTPESIPNHGRALTLIAADLPQCHRIPAPSAPDQPRTVRIKIQRVDFSHLHISHAARMRRDRGRSVGRMTIPQFHVFIDRAGRHQSRNFGRIGEIGHSAEFVSDEGMNGTVLELTHVPGGDGAVLAGRR